MYRLKGGIFVLITIISAMGTYTKELSKCDKLVSLAAWKDHNTIAETNLNTLAGTWTSEGCETRPGPDYVLRSYSFDRDGLYHLIQHHYWDDSCSSPKLTIISHGRLQLRMSIVQPDASNGLLKSANVSVIPQDARAARHLDDLVAGECPGQLWKQWRRNEEHLVFDGRREKRPNFNLWSQYYQPISNNHANGEVGPLGPISGDISCLGSLKWAFNELKLIKVQFRPVTNNFKRNQRQYEMELLLGDIHSSKKRREFYSPLAFQIPLIRFSKTPENFTINKYSFEVRNSNSVGTNLMSGGLKTPPHLIAKPHLPPYIWGEWSSTRCEIRPYDVYLHRRFRFNEDDFSWVGEHKFYSDPFCTHLKFIVTANGRFALSGDSEALEGVKNIDFRIESATLTATEERVIHDMRLEGVCGVGYWRANEPKDLTGTNGCIYLGIALPSDVFDVVKVEIDYNGSWLLFLGQTDTNNLPTVVNERPTAFQLAMVKCGEAVRRPSGLKAFLERGWRDGRSCGGMAGGGVWAVLGVIFGLCLFR